MTTIELPSLSAAYEPTRASLHSYALVMGTIARAHGIAHPKWWHISLKVHPHGLATDPIPLGSGAAAELVMDLRHHRMVFQTSDGTTHNLDLLEHPTATELGKALIDAATGSGLADSYERERFENDEPREYDPEAAEAYFDALVAVAGVFERRRAALGPRVSPVQVWPHGFDLAFEWFGTRTVEHEGEMLEAQLNLGFYPAGDQPYFYSTPWPFEPALLTAGLPDGAKWHTEGWSGAVVPYETVRTSPDPAATLTGFADAVFKAARSTLEAS